MQKEDATAWKDPKFGEEPIEVARDAKDPDDTQKYPKIGTAKTLEPTYFFNIGYVASYLQTLRVIQCC